MIHAHSTGVLAGVYQREKGWEEGPVENLQRVLRQEILQAVGVIVEDAVLSADDRLFPYEKHVEDMESLRAVLRPEDSSPDNRQAAITFYRDLLSMPLEERCAKVFAEVRKLPEQQLRAAMMVYAACRRRLSVV